MLFSSPKTFVSIALSPLQTKTNQLPPSFDCYQYQPERFQDVEEQHGAALLQEDGAGGRALVGQIPEGAQGELERDVGCFRFDAALDHGEQLAHVGGTGPELRGLRSGDARGEDAADRDGHAVHVHLLERAERVQD